MTDDSDVLIVGGGIAGAAAAYEIAATARVTLLERESQYGYHSTGRSAASFTENYGNGLVRRLVMASRGFLESPPTEFCEHPILSPRGLMTVAGEEHLELLEKQFALARTLLPTIVKITPSEAMARVPILKPGSVAAGLYEPDSREIDVSGLHQGFLRAAKARGAKLNTNAGVEGILRVGARWVVETRAGRFAAPAIVNAAGAWADGIARLAGVDPLGLVPMRRTAFNLPAPATHDCRHWPMVDDAAATYYFKPDAGRLLVSPADKTPVEPSDVQPDDIDVAIGVERFERATTYQVTRVARAWAGLRTFARDSSPVVGFDGTTEGFFWLAGQGGYGIKTSPALSRACAALIRGEPLPPDLLAQGISAEDLAPDRLRPPGSSRTGVVT